MQACHTLNLSGVSRNQLTHYLRRTGWLVEGQSGAFTEVMLRCIQQDQTGLVFVHLPDPDEPMPEPFLNALRQHPAVIVLSPYPARLFDHLALDAFAFLAEPFSFEQFGNCLERYVSTYG